MKEAQTSKLEQVRGAKRRSRKWKWCIVPVAVVAAIALAFYFSRHSLGEQRKLDEELKALPDFMKYAAEKPWRTSWSIKCVEKWIQSLPWKFTMLVLRTATDGVCRKLALSARSQTLQAACTRDHRCRPGTAQRVEKAAISPGGRT
ncbi:MAG: hypothetical protein ACYS8Z_02475 [Planctomycetota bacterium]